MTAPCLTPPRTAFPTKSDCLQSGAHCSVSRARFSRSRPCAQYVRVEARKYTGTQRGKRLLIGQTSLPDRFEERCRTAAACNLIGAHADDEPPRLIQRGEIIVQKSGPIRLNVAAAQPSIRARPCSGRPTKRDTASTGRKLAGSAIASSGPLPSSDQPLHVLS